MGNTAVAKTLSGQPNRHAWSKQQQAHTQKEAPRQGLRTYCYKLGTSNERFWAPGRESADAYKLQNHHKDGAGLGNQQRQGAMQLQ